MSKLILLLICVMALLSCQVASKHVVTSPPVQGVPQGSSVETPTPSPGNTNAVPAPVVSGDFSAPLTSRPKLALILGPGGLRSYAHAGLLQEIAKSKIPVSFIVGIEMGAMPAALFSLKGQPFEAEWQMMKLKEEDLLRSGLLAKAGPAKVDTLLPALQMMFAGARAEDSRIPFMCPSYSLAKRQDYMMNKGPFAQMLAYCVGFPPLFEFYQGNGAQPLALNQMVQQLKSKGANYIVYVDLISENPILESDSGWVWGVLQSSIEAGLRSVQLVVRIPGLAGVKAFDRRREFVQKGQEAGKKLVQQLQTTCGY